MKKHMLLTSAGILLMSLSIAAADEGETNGPPIGMQLDTNADGVWDHTYLGNNVWDPPLDSMLPPGTLIDWNGDDAADAIMVDQNGNGIADGIDEGMDGTVDYQMEESGGGGGGGEGDGGDNGDNNGPPIGMQLDTNADGVWDHTYLGDNVWDPPFDSMLPAGTLIDWNSDDVADAIMVDQNGNGIVDGIDEGMDGTVDYQMEESGGGGEGDGGDNGGPQAGTKLDTNADGVWDYTYLGNGEWDPPITSMPPPGTLVEFNGDNEPDAVLVDSNGNGIIDGIDIGMDGTVDQVIEEGSGGGGGGGGGGGPQAGTQLDTNADGVWDYVMLENGQFDPPLTSMPPPGTLVDMDGDDVADAILVDSNGNGIIDGIDIGMDGTVDQVIEEDGGGGGGGGGH